MYIVFYKPTKKNSRTMAKWKLNFCHVVVVVVCFYVVCITWTLKQQRVVCTMKLRIVYRKPTTYSVFSKFKCVHKQPYIHWMFRYSWYCFCSQFYSWFYCFQAFTINEHNCKQKTSNYYLHKLVIACCWTFSRKSAATATA